MKKVAFACLLLILATGAAFQGARIIALILEPMQLDYAESLVVWQSLQIFHPLAAFHRLDAFPLVVFSYPPIYLVATNLLMRILGNGLFAGRLISALSGFSIVVLQGWIVFRATRRYADVRSRFIAAFVTSAIALQLSSIRTWLPLARVDVMGVALQYCALAILVLGRFRWRNQIAAMMFLLLGVYTKQTLMAMPAAALLFLACIRLPRAIQLAAVFASAGTALLAASVWLTKGGVILHWFLYNISPFSWQRALNTELALLSPTIVILACGLGGFLNFVPRRRVAARLLASPLRRTAALFGLAFAAAFVTSLSVGKMGSNINYGLEWQLALCPLAGLLVSAVLRNWERLERTILAPFFLAALTLTAAQWVVDSVTNANLALGFTENARLRLQTLRWEERDLQEIAAAAPGPVVSENMMVLLRAGKDIVVEPWAVFNATATGAFDERDLLDKTSRQYFGAFILRKNQEQRFTPTMLQTIHAAYGPIPFESDRYLVLVPKAQGGNRE